MPGYSFKTNPDGTVTTVVDGPVYSGTDKVKVGGTGGGMPGGWGIAGALQDPTLGPLMGMNPLVAIPAGASASLSSVGAGISELQRSGDLGRAWQAGNRRYVNALETTPALGAQRVIYNASRNLGVSLFGNLPASTTRKPGDPDSPLFGVIPAPPKAKSAGVVEDVVTDLVQGALMFIPVARGVGLTSQGLLRLPGAAAIAQTVGSAGRIPATLQAMSAATQGIGGVSGGLQVSATAARIAGGIVQRGSQGAIAGAITDFAGYTPGERTTASSIVDLVKTNEAAKAALNWVDRAAGTPLHRPLQALVLSDGNDTDLDSRFKESIFGLGLGAAAENALYGAGLLARQVFRHNRQATQAAEELAQQVPAEGQAAEVPAAQQTVDVTTAPAATPTTTPTVTQTTGEPPLPPRVVIDIPWNQGGGIQRSLQPISGADVNQAADNAATKLAHLGNTVSDELGPVAPENRGAWRPTYSQVQETPVANIFTNPQLLQFKEAGRLTKTGVSGSLKEANSYDPLFAKIISVWENPADGKLYVVNGHNRLALAQRSGVQNILTWKIEAKTAEEARAIGAMENIAEGQGTPWDAAKIMRDMGLSPEELRTRGIDLKGAVARDAIPLSRLPQNVFTQGVTGKLTIDKAIALGSEPIDEALIQDVYGRAVKGKWSAAKIEQAVQEAKFADVRVDDGGTLPGMGEWFKTTNFNELLDVRTELFRLLREEMIALTSASQESRKQFLEQAGNVIDVAGSRQAKEKAAAGLDLFNRVAGTEGPVRELLKEMAGLVGNKRPAKTLAGEYLPQIRQAIEAQVNGPRLPFVQPPAKEITPKVPAPKTLEPAPVVTTAPGIDPADIAALRDTSGLSPEDAALINEIADLLEGMDKATTETLATTKKMLDQAAAIEELMPTTPDIPPSPREEAIRKLNAAFNMPTAEVPAVGTGAITPEVLPPGGMPAAPAVAPAELPDTRGQGQFFHGSSTPIKELKAESDVPGITPESGTLEIIYQTATTKGRNIYGQGFYATDDLKTASSYQKKGTGTAPVVYQIKEKNLNLRFYDLDQQIGQDAVDDIFTKMPGMDREQVLDAVDDGLMGQQYQSLGQALDLIRKANGALRSQDVFDGIKEYLITQGYGGFTHQGGNLAGGGERLHQVRIYWDPAKDLTIEKYTPPAADQSAPATPATPAAPANPTIIPLTEQPLETVVPQVVTQEIQIPPGASRPLPPGSPRIETVSQSIAKWLGTSQDEARSMLLAKNEVLDVTKVPGIDLEKALDDVAMGRTSPETEAITRAYQQFYGPSSRQQQEEMLSLVNRVDGAMPDQLPESMRVDPEIAAAVKEAMMDVVRRIAGDDIAFIFEEGMAKKPGTRAHGTQGQMRRTLGNYRVNSVGIIEDGDPIQEIVQFNEMGWLRYEGQSMIDWTQQNLATAAHEAFHIIQNRYLSSKQLDVLDNVFARIRLYKMTEKNMRIAAEREATGAQPQMPIELQPQAFEGFDQARREGVSPALVILGMSKENVEMFKEVAADRNSPAARRLAARFGELIFSAVKILDNLADFTEKLWNAFRGRGWTSIRDIFSQAAAGELKVSGAARGNVYDLYQVAGDFKNATDEGNKEWGRRVRALLKQGSPYETLRFVGESERLFSEFASEAGPPRTPPTPPMPDGPGDEGWATRFARVLADNEAALKSGDITMEELYVLNRMQKTESPSGSQVYTTKSQELIPGYAAMSQVLPDRPTATGYPIFNGPEIVAKNQAWFDSHGWDGKAIMAGIGSLQQGFRGHEMGALNRAMSYADMLQKEAQIQAAQWLNSSVAGSVNRSERLAALITAADNARRVHLAIANVTRPWGQAGAEMQLPRDYQVPANVIETPAGVEPPPSMIEQQINQELAQGDANPNAVFEEITDVLDPELTEAAKGGEITPQAEAAADALADFINSGGVDPGIRSNTWEQMAELAAAKPGGLMKGGVQNKNNPLLMLRVNNLISAGITASTNLMNGTFNLARLMGAQAVGALTHGDLERFMYSSQMLWTTLSNIQNGFRVAGHAMKAGESLMNMGANTIEQFGRIAAKDAQGRLLETEDSMTGWTLNTMNMKTSFAETMQGRALNAAWAAIMTPGSRVAIGIDSFNSTLAGHSFEHFNHMPRGMQLAVERGLAKFSPEAWEYANRYAKARVQDSLKDVIINGRTLADAAITGPDAKKFMDSVNFTEKMIVNLEPRTLAEGMRLGELRGLKDQELTDWATQYVKEGNRMHKIANGFMDGFNVKAGPFNVPIPGVARIGSVPGLTLQGLSSIPYVGPVFRFIQPFQTVPSNIIKQAMRGTPAAIFVDSFWRDITSENPAVRQRATGEIAIGSAALTLAFTAMSLGYVRINGGGPLNPVAKEKWMRDRQMPYSMQFWDATAGRWSDAYSLAMLEPFASLWGAMGDYSDVANSLPSETRKRLGAALNLELAKMQVSGLLSKTYFQGINEFYEAAFNPSKTFQGAGTRNPIARLASRMVASMVPESALLRAWRRQVDPVARSVNPAQTGSIVMDLWQETWDEIRNAVPGWSESLPPRRDWTQPGSPPVVLPGILGTELINDDVSFLSGAMQFMPFSAMRVGQSFRSPVQEEMANLHGKGTAFGGPRAADFGPEMRLTPSELSEYQLVFGTVKDEFGYTWHDRMSQMLNEPGYQALPVEAPSNSSVSQRAVRIQLLINQYKDLAKKRYIETTAKGAQIGQEQTRQENLRREAEFNRQYGVPGAPQSPSTELFLREMNP